MLAAEEILLDHFVAAVPAYAEAPSPAVDVAAAVVVVVGDVVVAEVVHFEWDAAVVVVAVAVAALGAATYLEAAAC